MKQVVDIRALDLDKKLIKKAVVAGARLVARTAKQKVLTSQGGGRQYGSHTSSAPGTPPANWQGVLAGSIRARAGRGVAASVIDSAWYALALEIGSRGGGGTKGSRNKRGQPMTTRIQLPRPFLETSLQQQQPAIEKLIQAAAQDAMSLGGKRGQ